MAIIGDSGGGKALPLYALIVTPDGFRKMGEIKVGDLVMGADGRPHPVTGVYPQGVKEIYRVTFSDKTTVECCDDHLWTVRHASQGTKDRWVVKPLSEIRRDLFKGPHPSNGHRQHKWSVPMTRPVEYSARDFPIDPYLLGALLGDGGLSDARERAVLSQCRPRSGCRLG